jgi:hypothetical protein
VIIAGGNPRFHAWGDAFLGTGLEHARGLTGPAAPRPCRPAPAIECGSPRYEIVR